MAAKGRPVSPHVTIYAFPVVAISSITVRVTGVMLTIGTTGVAALAMVHPDVAGLMMDIGNSGAGKETARSVFSLIEPMHVVCLRERLT